MASSGSVVGRHVAGDPGDAGVAGRGAQADGFHRGSGDTRPYVGAVDIAMMYSVVDIAGINRISARILGNAAAAIAGMAGAMRPASRHAGPPADRRHDVRGHDPGRDRCPGVARSTPASRCWCSTPPEPAGNRWRRWPRGGSWPGCSTSRPPSWPTSWSAACSRPARIGSKWRDRWAFPRSSRSGALDMVNFGPMETVPERFRERNLYVHNATMTLMRTTPEENAPSLAAGSARSSMPRRVRWPSSSRAAASRRLPRAARVP